jgi:predicted nucleotidyltransferase
MGSSEMKDEYDFSKAEQGKFYRSNAVLNIHLKEMERIVSQISHKYSPEKIILFGSLASDRATTAHDIDLLVIKQTDKNPWQRTREVNGLFEHTLPVDLLVYTPEEIVTRVEMNDFFILDIMEHGKVVYERSI